MNCQGVKDELHLQLLLSNPSFVAQEKLDGMRAVAHITKTGLRIFSRSAGVKDPTRPLEKTSSLPHLAKLTFPDLVGTVLDGEILIPGKHSAEIAGSVHRKNGNNGLVKLFVFDILRFCGRDLTDKTLAERLPLLLTTKLMMQGTDDVRFLPFATTLEAKEQLYQSVFKNGGEGIVLKNLVGKYIEGGRPKDNWMKYKRCATFDCVVMGFTRGKGKFATSVGSVVFGQFLNGKLTELGQASGMADSVRNDMSDYPEKYIGKVVVIKGMERLKSLAIRHPRFVGFRDDKSPRECVAYATEK